MYRAIKDYEAICPDEISFNYGDVMEVLAMSNFGWWQVRYGNYALVKVHLYRLPLANFAATKL